MRALIVGAVSAAFCALSAGGQQPFSVKDVLSAPYALGLTASPVGARFAWVENAEGVRNVWVAGVGEAARPITKYTEDDGQDIGGLAWSPDGASIAYALGAETGASGKPANPAELQRSTAVTVWVAFVGGGEPVRVGEGRAPLFLADRRLLFVRGGQIWVTDGTSSAAKAGSSNAPGMDGLKPVPNKAGTGGPGTSEQLVFDRGSAGGLTVSPDGKLLAYVSRRRGHSFIGLYEFATRTLRFVSPSSGNDSAPVFSPDGKQLAWLREPFTEAKEFEANRVSANSWSVQVASVADLQAKTTYQPEAGKRGSVIPRFATGSPRVWWAAGGKLLFCSEVDGWVHLYAVDVSASKSNPVLLTPGRGEVEDVSVAPDGQHVLWATNIRWPIFSYDGFTACMATEAGIDSADDDRRHIWQVDLTDLKKKPDPFRTGGGQRITSGEGIETHPLRLNDGTIIAFASDSFSPMHPVYMTEYANVMKDVRPDWLPSRYPQAKLVFPEQVLFPFRSSNASQSRANHSSVALKVHAQLFFPGNTKAVEGDPLPICNGHSLRSVVKHPKLRPAIVFFHGGPRRQMLLGYPAMDYYSNAYAMNQYLAAQGYIVLSVNYRCGIGYGLEFRQCEHAGADGASEYNDALAAVEYLRSRGDVDMKRVGIWGGSYGGYFTALGLARNSDLFAAGVDFHGVHDWTREDNAPGDWLKGSNAEVDEIAKRAVASSPIADVAKWRSPVLLIHGDDDPEVAYNQTPLLADALRAKGVHVEELIFPDEVHGFLLHKDWVKAYEAEAEFFARMLK